MLGQDKVIQASLQEHLKFYFRAFFAKHPCITWNEHALRLAKYVSQQPPDWHKNLNQQPKVFPDSIITEYITEMYRLLIGYPSTYNTKADFNIKESATYKFFEQWQGLLGSKPGDSSAFVILVGYASYLSLSNKYKISLVDQGGELKKPNVVFDEIKSANTHLKNVNYNEKNTEIEKAKEPAAASFFALALLDELIEYASESQDLLNTFFKNNAEAVRKIAQEEYTNFYKTHKALPKCSTDKILFGYTSPQKTAVNPGINGFAFDMSEMMRLAEHAMYSTIKILF
tara:strand:+ start:3952 stop:4806 length:855 start_codon:yes stop_codon:yes gene_type:complete